jgi:cobalamin biosynthesis protein CobD/CbiB
MAAISGALERRLEKPGQYVLGDANAPATAVDIRSASLLTGVAAALFTSCALAVLLWGKDQ